MSSPARNAARLKIIQTANRYRIAVRRRRSVHSPAAMFSGRHLQLAVFVCRQHHLVDDATLLAAGFRPCRRRVEAAAPSQKAA